MPERFSIRVLRNQPSPSAADSAADSDAFLFIFICNYEHLSSASSRGELCKSRGGRPGIPFPNKPDHGFCVSQMAATELFSASEQTHCALVVCDSERVTISLHSACFFFNIYRSGYSAV